MIIGEQPCPGGASGSLEGSDSDGTAWAATAPGVVEAGGWAAGAAVPAGAGGGAGVWWSSWRAAGDKIWAGASPVLGEGPPR